MGDLHSIAYSGNLHNSSLGWDFHSLEVFKADTSHFMASSTPPFSSPANSDLSTGYLQDALLEFSSKRRRLLLFSDDQTKDPNDQSCWDSYRTENCQLNPGYLNHTNDFDANSDKPAMDSLSGIVEQVTDFTGAGDQAISTSEGFDSSLSSHSRDSDNAQSLFDKETLYPIGPMYLSGGGEKRKKKVVTRVVYPFALVKPGGIQGDVTINDINERILMAPTRPVRHPVGDFACRPLVSPDGPGLSGKAVVALTRIQTQGRGTITIIRTKG
ncbi:hypothetical protein RJ639_012319 [Escallonia herrerae]|uniref:Protein XRI1 n=1 Tax=Escallonia herrerae TaxID=1293975 RepID=A0AA89AQF6_9ASTE|nr:hypothetical protein RJ639_012319 [Escallonia herrerae]